MTFLSRMGRFYHYFINHMWITRMHIGHAYWKNAMQERDLLKEIQEVTKNLILNYLYCLHMMLHLLWKTTTTGFPFNVFICVMWDSENSRTDQDKKVIVVRLQIEQTVPLLLMVEMVGVGWWEGVSITLQVKCHGKILWIWICRDVTKWSATRTFFACMINSQPLDITSDCLPRALSTLLISSCRLRTPRGPADIISHKWIWKRLQQDTLSAPWFITGISIKVDHTNYLPCYPHGYEFMFQIKAFHSQMLPSQCGTEKEWIWIVIFFGIK